MSTVELIYEKAKALPAGQQSEALGFVEYLSRLPDAEAEAAEWKRLLRNTQSLGSVQSITEDDVAAEITRHRGVR